MASACSSSNTTAAPDATGSCRTLASKCHSVKTPLAQECHDLGHDGDDQVCGPRQAECLAACEGGTGHDDEQDVDAGSEAGATTDDAGADVNATTPCATYCACMAATCASRPNYPYADEAGCLDACAKFPSDGLTCVRTACEKAKAAADKAHECDHASAPVGCH